MIQYSYYVAYKLKMLLKITITSTRS